MNSKIQEQVDIAIIGGGIAGLYAVWRLGQDPNFKGKKVALFESEDRLGGRLHSIVIPGIPYAAELGAMRYAPEQHLINSLVRRLGLGVETFDVKTTAFYLRGCYFTEKDLGVSNDIPYNLRENEVGKKPADLILSAIKEILKHLSFPTLAGPPRELYWEELVNLEPKYRVPKYRTRKEQLQGQIIAWINGRGILDDRDWSDISKHGKYSIAKIGVRKPDPMTPYQVETSPTNTTIGVHLFQLGFWNLLQHFLSNEATLFAHDGLGYESIVGNWNLAEAIPWFIRDFQFGKYEMLIDGFESLIHVLEAEIASLGVEITKSCKLLEVEDAGDSSTTRLRFWRDDEEVEVLAGKVVLALPKTSLKKIDFRSVDLKDLELFRTGLLDSVHAHKLFKIFLAYEYPWWKEYRKQGFPLNTESGRIFSDLPIRQVYYFGPRWIKQHSSSTAKAKTSFDAFEDLSLIMASYSDSHYVSFWRPFFRRPNVYELSSIPGMEPYPSPLRYIQDTAGKATDYGLALERFREENKQFLAPHRMVLKVHAELAELHNAELDKIPPPIICVYRDWGEAPNEGGWHTWEVNTQPWDLTRDIVHPFQKKNIYICGEAYSRDQGWVEGSLKSVELMLELLGAERPDWIQGSVNIRLEGTEESTASADMSVYIHS